MGVDPGGRETGVVVRVRRAVVFVRVVVRRDPGWLATGVYLNDVLDTVAEARAVAGPGARVGVEGLSKPQAYMRGQLRPVSHTALVSTAMVYAVVIAVFGDQYVVPPGGNGSAPLQSYPRDLIGGPHNERYPRSEPKGEGLLRHARSAFDVAGTAARIRVRRPA